jgi:oligopeptide/dipeptide ABC transporter ATP-binding protein
VADVILEARDLTKHFQIRKGTIVARQVGAVKAVDGISFSIQEGDTFGLVGESGCGKTTTAKLILLLESSTSGQILFMGKEIQHLPLKETAWYRRLTQAVFQDPYSSLNPRMRVGDIIAEPLRAHGNLNRREMQDRILQVLEIVGLPPAAADMYPHEFSGGQRQRIAIARALAPDPRFMVLDEPVSALDVSIRAQIINLLREIQAEFSLTYLIIAHDLALVEHVSTISGVMYLGKIVELAASRELYTEPLHPYTRALVAASPRPNPRTRGTGFVLTGEVPSPANPPLGCHFHPRCVHAEPRCSREEPQLNEVSPGHKVACHLLA